MSCGTSLQAGYVVWGVLSLSLSIPLSPYRAALQGTWCIIQSYVALRARAEHSRAVLVWAHYLLLPYVVYRRRTSGNSVDVPLVTRKEGKGRKDA